MAPRLGLGGGVTADPASTLFAANLFLDNFPSAYLAYSVRKLRFDYTGYAMKVREGSGMNYEADVGFDAAGIISLDSPIANKTGGSGPTLGHFVDAGGADSDALVKTWYDQSGNGRDVTQGSASLQPKVVSSGAVVTQDGKAAVDFDSDALEWADATVVSQPITYMTVARKDSTGGRYIFDRKLWFSVINNQATSLALNGTNEVGITNGSGSTGTGDDGMDGLALGARYNGSNPWAGNIQEFIRWGGD